MITNNKFAEAMSKRSDAELNEIVSKLRDDYQAEAIIAAEEELKRRKLSGNNVVQPENKKEKHKVNRANLPLDANSKIFAMLFPRPVRFLIDFELKDKGYIRRYKEWRQWTLIGVLFYTLIIIITMLLIIFV